LAQSVRRLRSLALDYLITSLHPLYHIFL
jgi:hypothetical protein